MPLKQCVSLQLKLDLRIHTFDFRTGQFTNGMALSWLDPDSSDTRGQLRLLIVHELLSLLLLVIELFVMILHDFLGCY